MEDYLRRKETVKMDHLRIVPPIYDWQRDMPELAQEEEESLLVWVDEQIAQEDAEGLGTN